MANPKLPGIPEAEQALLYAKLNEYNRGRASFKEAGVYLVVLPRPGKPNYSLWLYSRSGSIRLHSRRTDFCLFMNSQQTSTNHCGWQARCFSFPGVAC